jgi:hypothetical protein
LPSVKSAFIQAALECRHNVCGIACAYSTEKTHNWSLPRVHRCWPSDCAGDSDDEIPSSHEMPVVTKELWMFKIIIIALTLASAQAR